MVASQQKGDTGQGATFALSTITFSVRIKKINGVEITLDSLLVSALVDTGFDKYVPGDLKKVSHLVIDFYWDTLTAFPAIGSDPAVTATITWPTRTTESTPENIAGTGFVCGYKTPDLELGGIQMGQLTFCYDGATGPTNTPAA